MNEVRIGSAGELDREGRLVGKVGDTPVLVVVDGGCALAIEDRCPHLGFPLHRGTVADGLITCHWHHARFDLRSGGTLDPWADDARPFAVRVVGDDVLVHAQPDPDPLARHRRRLREGLEQGLTLVVAKSVLAMIDEPGGIDEIVAAAAGYGLTERGDGWGSGLTVLAAVVNLLPDLEPGDRVAALVHALSFVADDTRGRSPRHPLSPLGGDGHPNGGYHADRLAGWFRNAVETRSSAGAERVLATATALDPAAAEAMLFAAITDHSFIDGGHTFDFANKAVELTSRLEPCLRSVALTALVGEACRADRSEESAEWRQPVDVAGLADRTIAALRPGPGGHPDIVGLAERLLADDAEAALGALVAGAVEGASAEELARAVAHAAALRILRFHTSNDHGDWNTVHHAFTYANAVHQAVVRAPSPELLRAVVHGAAQVHLDRFLNVPAARAPKATAADLVDLAACWDAQGHVEEAAEIVAGALRSGTPRAVVVAALAHAAFAEDAEFHRFQIVEAGARHAAAWPDGSEAVVTTLAAVARFLAAHSPTRRELATVLRTADRLSRGAPAFEDAVEEVES